MAQRFRSGKGAPSSLILYMTRRTQTENAAERRRLIWKRSPSFAAGSTKGPKVDTMILRRAY